MNRKSFLWQSGGGLGGVALAHLLAQKSHGKSASDLNGGLHHPAKVKRVIQLFMNGGASPMDTFDYKPELARLHGQKIGPENTPEGFTGKPGSVLKSPFEFKQHGQSGQWVSSVFPHQAKHVDDMAFLMAMKTKTNVHGPAAYMMNSGFLLPGFPCLGAWTSYALGNLTDNLPTFVVLPDGRGLPYNERGTFSSGFLPPIHQGTVIKSNGKSPVPHLFANEKFSFATSESESDGLALLKKINRSHATQHSHDPRLESRIRAYELAAKMQLSAPEAFDLSSEPKHIYQAYGTDNATTEDFGRRCLLARRLCERGTRFVQVWSGPQGNKNNRDNHGSISKELTPIAAAVDKPIAALLQDLKQRGLLEDTLLVWTTEFGRTPFAQGADGRDHNGGTFVTWMAGAGIKAGTSYGQSDDLAFQTAEGTTYCYDLHATILHLMGIDHEKLTVRQNGIDRRLTDVHGHVVQDILS